MGPSLFVSLVRGVSIVVAPSQVRGPPYLVVAGVSARTSPSMAARAIPDQVVGAMPPLTSEMRPGYGHGADSQENDRGKHSLDIS